MMRAMMVAGAALGCLLLAMPASQAQTPSFAKKTVNIYIANTAGGSYDLYGRLIARHLGNHLPGNPAVVANNMPGGGGIVAANYLYQVAPKDGTAMAVLIETVAVEQALQEPTVKYDAAKFTWIGRVASSVNIHFQWHTSKVQSIEDAFKYETTVAGAGPGNLSEIVPKILDGAIGTKFKVISGYPASNEAMIAMERGEVEGHSSTYDSVKAVHPDWITDKRVNIVVQYSLRRHPELADVPTTVELARNEEQRGILTAVASAAEIGKFILSTPGVPTDRVTALRRAFDAMVKDDEFIAEAQKLRIELLPLAGEELQQIVRSVQDLSPDLTQKIKAMYPN
jgi:tripartite-type tricarboxylate transporter receptor subunit TctC